MNTEETTSKAAAGLHDAQESLEDLSRTARATLDAARHGTAAALENAAASVRAAGHGGAETVGAFADTAAGKLDSTAAYVRSHDVGGMLLSLRQLVVRHPASSVILAAGLAFLAGSEFRRIKPHE